MTKFSDRNFRFHMITGIVIAGVTIVLYHSTLDYPFIFDDSQNIVENPNIRVSALDVQSLASVIRAQHPTLRPVAYLSFAVNYRFSGYAPRWYRVINIGIHVVNGVLVYILCLLILIRVHGRCSSQSNRRDRTTDDAVHRQPSTVHPYFLAAAVSIIWTVHPLQTQSVTYIVQRMNSLAALFFLSAVCLYLVGRLAGRRMLSWSCFGGVVIAWGLALGSKQIAITLPVVLLLIEWFFFQDLDRAWLLRSVKYWLIPLAVAGLVAVIYLKMKPIANILAAYELREFTMWERVLTQFRVIILYFTLLIYPHPGRLNLDHHVLASKSVVEPISTLTSIIVIAGLLCLSIVIARRHRLASFCILWFFINLALESSIIGLEMMHEHRMYLPSVGFFTCLVWLFIRYFPVLVPHQGVIALVMAVIPLSLATLERNKVWRDPFVFWSDCVAKSPNKPRTLTNFGFFLKEQGKVDEAIDHYRRALSTNPKYPLAHNNLGVALIDKRQYAKAIVHCRRALELKSNYADAHDNLGIALSHSNQPEAAVKHLSEALRLNPGNPDTHNNLGNVYLGVDRLDEALLEYRRALEINPAYVSAYNGIAAVLVKQDDLEGAVENFQHAIRRDPDYTTARQHCVRTMNDLGDRHMGRRQLPEAVRWYRAALEMNPDNAPVQNNLGAALGQLGRLEDAIACFRAAVRIQPDYADAHRNLEGARRLHEQQSDAAKSAAPK